MKSIQDASQKMLLVFENQNIAKTYSLVLKGPRNTILVSQGFDQALKTVKKERPTVIICDPFPAYDHLGGMEFIHKVRQEYPSVKILVVADLYNEEIIMNIFRAGATGFVLYKTGIEELFRAVQDMVAGGAPMSKEVAACLVQSYQIAADNPLTRREQDVLRHVSMGKTYQYIANDLHVSLDTIRTHVQHIFEKLEVRNKSEAVMKARSRRLV